MERCLSNGEQAGSVAQAALLPVFAALDSARFLRREIDLLDAAEGDEIVQLRHEVAMLRHWIQVLDSDCTEYSALAEGLWTFADQVEDLLPAAAE